MVAPSGGDTDRGFSEKKATIDGSGEADGSAGFMAVEETSQNKYISI